VIPLTFEEALVAELESVSGLSGKVFPLNAAEGTKPPYLIYISSDGLPDKTLTGYTESKTIPLEINIICRTYTDLKSLTPAVLAKIRSFQRRTIGMDGPYVQDVAYDEPVELLEPQVMWYRSNFDLRISI